MLDALVALHSLYTRQGKYDMTASINFIWSYCASQEICMQGYKLQSQDEVVQLDLFTFFVLDNQNSQLFVSMY